MTSIVVSSSATNLSAARSHASTFVDVMPAPSVLDVVVEAEVGERFFADHPAQRVLQLRQLDEQVVLGIETRCNLRRLEVEAQPLLDAAEAGALREVAEQHEVERERRREDRVAAQEVDLHLHRIVEPSDDVDVVPALFVVTAR